MDVTQCLREALSLPVQHFRVTPFGAVDGSGNVVSGHEHAAPGPSTAKDVDELLQLLYGPAAPKREAVAREPHTLDQPLVSREDLEAREDEDEDGGVESEGSKALKDDAAQSGEMLKALDAREKEGTGAEAHAATRAAQQQALLEEDPLEKVLQDEGEHVSPAKVYGRGKHSNMWMSLAKRKRSRRLPQSIIDRLLLGADTDSLDAVLPQRYAKRSRSSSRLDDPRQSLSRSPRPSSREGSSTASSRCASPSAERQYRWPHVPLCQHLAHSIQEWGLLHAKEHDSFSAAECVAEEMYKQEQLLALGTERTLSRECRALGTFMHRALESGDHRRVLRAFDRLLCFLTVDDLQWFLGMQHTVGTVAGLPPPCCELVASFQALNAPEGPSRLTKGARALLKHCNRDRSLAFWGHPTGPEDAKNESALTVLYRILDHATWMNVHTLPHSVHVFEVRTARGYGARWTANGKYFRGFLEPQIPNGHSVGWVH